MQPEVIRASRKWVCIRPATYENAQEARILERIFVGRSGQLENTVFALLGPDGKTLLAPPGRSPRFDFGTASYLAEAMDWYVEPYLTRNWGERPLPTVKSYRLALNVASCDRLPLIVYGSEWEDKLKGLAWKETLMGQAIFVRRADVKGAKVVKPDKFGTTGETVEKLSPDVDARSLARLLKKHRLAAKNTRSHIEEGRRKGVNWQTAIPVTDPHARR